MRSVFSTVMTIIIVFVEVTLVPMLYLGINAWSRDDFKAQRIASSLVDEIIDTRQLDEERLADFNLSVAELYGHYKGTVERQMEVIQPDPANPGKTYSVYLDVDDITQYNQGDLVIVTIENIGYNAAMAMACQLFNLPIYTEPIRFPARVR